MVFLDINQVNEIDDELRLFKILFKLSKNTRNPYIISHGGRITQHLVEFLARNGRTIDENIYNSTFKDFLKTCDYIPEPIKNFILFINDLRKNVVYSSKDKNELDESMVYYLEIFYEILKWFENYYDEEFLHNEMKFKEISKTKRFLNRKIDEYDDEDDLEESPNETESLILSEMKGLRNEMKAVNNTVNNIEDTVNDTNETVHDIKDTAEDTNKTVHILDYKMDQFIEKFEEYHKEYAKNLEKISEKVDENISEEELDKIMKKFTDRCSEEIKTCVETSIAKEDYKKEEERLMSSLTNENWNKLSRKSQTWLTTSIITYKGIKKLKNIVDYSGVCLLVTKAFEVELYKRFFKGFSDYLFDEYKKDYSKYHTSLVGNYFHGHKYRLKKPRECDLGTITYVFCYKKDEKIKDDKIHQNNIDKLIEYSKLKYFNDLSEEEIKNKFCTYGEYVDKIRKEYRNRAAHDKELSITDARSCFNYVFKVDQVLKIMLDSFDK